MSSGDIKALADAVKSEAGRDRERILNSARSRLALGPEVGYG